MKIIDEFFPVFNIHELKFIIYASQKESLALHKRLHGILRKKPTALEPQR